MFTLRSMPLNSYRKIVFIFVECEAEKTLESFHIQRLQVACKVEQLFFPPMWNLIRLNKTEKRFSWLIYHFEWIINHASNYWLIGSQIQENVWHFKREERARFFLRMKTDESIAVLTYFRALFIPRWKCHEDNVNNWFYFNWRTI